MSVLTQDNPNDYGLIIKDTEDMGLGVFAERTFAVGEKICPYAYQSNQVMSIKEYRKKYGKSNLYTYRSMRHHTMIYVGDNRNVITYINERKDEPNVELKKHKLFATQNIKMGDELFLKYWYKTKFKIKNKILE